MRILIAPDAFKGTLTAVEAAAAIAEGWRRTRAETECLQRPVSDGGPGFVRSMAAARGLEPRTLRTTDAAGRPIDAEWCCDAATAYIEVAQVVGLHLGMQVTGATSAGVGELIREAIGNGARTIVLGLGGTGVNDAGAGLLAALGATARDGAGRPVPLDLGPLPLAAVAHVDLSAAEHLLQGVDLVAATDVDVPLLGPRGASFGFASQKGATPSDIAAMEAAITAFAAACGRRADGRDAAVALGAGAAGGLGFALLRLGGTRVPGIAYVLDASGIDVAGVDLVVTGEGCLDWQSMRGKVVSGLASRAQAAGVPVIAIAGRVDITARERAEMGLDAAYSVAELMGEEAAVHAAAGSLRDTAARVARTWG